MRASEFLLESVEQVDEVSMRPSHLRQEAAKTNATAGIEFEMVVPGFTDDDDQEMEPDMDQDERITDFGSIEDFFGNGDNSPRAIRGFMEEIKEGYTDWALEKRDEDWNDNGFSFFSEYAEDYFDEDEAMAEAENEVDQEYGDELSPNDKEKIVSKLVEQKKETYLEDLWNDQGRIYDRAREVWEENEWEWPDEGQYLRGEGYRFMSDLPWEGEVDWPYYTTTEESSVDIKQVASDFQEFIGKKVNSSELYHGGERAPNTYVIEPDSSIKGDDGEGGLEFISPPLPLDEMLTDFNKIIKWAREQGYKTNSSTGLHMNVSVPSFTSLENLDYVKLALLLGDEYVLREFGRISNTYTKSAMSKIMQRISNADGIGILLQQMREGLSNTASRIIHNRITDKYTSINVKDGYIEFRSPGGDWLNADWKKLETTLLRFVVALDAACDPQKYRQDYLKKLYAILQPKSENDPIAYFAKYAAGELPKTALNSFIRQIQANRSRSKLQAQHSPTGEWGIWSKIRNMFIMLPDNTARRFDSSEQAQAFLQNSELDPNKFEVQRLDKPQITPQGQTWSRWIVSDANGNQIGFVSGRDHVSASTRAISLFPNLADQQFTVRPENANI